MKTGRSLQEVLVELQRQQSAKRDYVSPAATLNLLPDGRTLEMGERHFTATDLFHRQVGAALSIPAKYYDAMRREKPALLAENVNAWLGDRDQSYMIRAMEYPDEHPTARAFLSDRYRRIDNLEVAEAVLPLFAGQAGLEICSTEVTDSRLYIKVVNHRLEMACVGGARAMGLADCDDIAEGKRADLIVIDLQRPNMQPLHNLTKNLVYAGSKENVRLTMVNGKVLYQNGAFFVGDEPAKIYAEANAFVRGLDT
jgi:hypothetical protein